MKYKTFSGKEFIALPLRGGPGFTLLSIFALLEDVNGEESNKSMFTKLGNLSKEDQTTVEDKLKQIILQQNRKLKEDDIVIDGYLDLNITTIIELFGVYQGQQEDKKK